MATKEQTFELAGGIFRVRPDGIVVGSPTAKDLELEDAKEFVELWRRIKPEGKIRLLLDQRGVSRKMTPGAREYLSTATRDAVERIAILVSNTFSRFFASGVLAATGLGKTLKARAFDSEQLAIAWLRENDESTATRRAHG